MYLHKEWDIRRWADRRLANYTESDEELVLWVARAIELTEKVFGFVKTHSELAPLQLHLALEREGLGRH